MHTLYCVLGRTSSGKSEVTKRVAEKLNMNILKSYTTRKMRGNETENNADHIFIYPDDVEQYKNDMVAYTERVGYCSFATKQQVMESDFYIINPSGYYELKDKLKDCNVRIVSIYITAPYSTISERAKKRGDFATWKDNYDAETKEFETFKNSNDIDFYVLNDTEIEYAVDKMIHVIEKDIVRNVN